MRGKKVQAAVECPTDPVPVAVLGGTGLVGQKLIELLAGHSWFAPVEIAGSQRSVGRMYGEAVQWAQDTPMPESVRDVKMKPAHELESWVVFSALPAMQALELEPLYLSRGHAVISNSSPFRLEAGVPLVIPEVNAGVLPQARWGREAVLIKNPNCVVAGLALALAPLKTEFGLKRLVVVTQQALSGAGAGGPVALDMLNNLVPHIEGEASKIELETRKILDSVAEISVSVTRVPVTVGHLGSVFVEFEKRAAIPEIVRCLENFRAPAALRRLPSVPGRPLIVRQEVDRPQPRLDLAAGDGMAVTVGGLSKDPVFDLKFNFLVDNLVRGAAGGALANAELLRMPPI